MAADKEGYKLTYKRSCAFIKIRNVLEGIVDGEAIFHCEPHGKGIIKGSLIDGGFKNGEGR